MQIVTISDLHTYHRDTFFNEWLRDIPNHEESMIIFAGDSTSSGTLSEAVKFLEWYQELNFKWKIKIAGNHDWVYERSPAIIENLLASEFPSIHYLNDSGVTLDGINIWGSPVQPWFHNWAFNRWRGEDIKKHWDLIPNNTDILVTHSPAYLKGDRVKHGEHVGCKDLLHKIEEIKPKLHISGHIHEGYGVYNNEHTLFFNASQLDQHYSLVNKPLVHIFEK